ncbi:MAG: membrane integrity-associated transporter subunit PqiC [Proteobacteria bacterium]|nr:membrane integrity-associated transporter subunit PqiC [Pseudomonadota bacterium]
MSRAFILVAMLGLSGCISLLPNAPPPPRTFMLSAGDVAQAPGQAIDAVIAVAQPSGERALLGTDMVWSTGNEVAYVAQTQWSAHADEALQAMLVETLSRQHRFRAAVRSGEAGAQYEVRWEILNFQIDSASMTARLRADVKLTQAPGRQVIAQEIIEAAAPVADRSQTNAAAALTQAAREGAARIALFAADRASQAPTNAPRAQ